MTLEFDHLKYRVGDFKLSAHFQLRAGSKYLLLGPSGAGKSTFFDLVAGFIAPNEGAIRFQGQTLDGLPPYKRPVSFIQQNHNLFAHLTVFENAAIGLDGNLRRAKLKKDEIMAVLSDLGIADLAQRKPREISGGQVMRTVIARILLQNRDIILLDEAFSSLGPAQRAQMREIIADRLGGKDRILILSSHLNDDIQSWPDQILWCEQGLVSAPITRESFAIKPPKTAKLYLNMP